MNINLAELKPASVYSADIEGTHVIVEGEFTFLTEGTGTKQVQSIQTVKPNEWVTFYFSPPVVRFDLEAHGIVGQEQNRPTVRFCGMNTYDGKPLCMEEYRAQTNPAGKWAMGSPANDEWRIGVVNIKNMEMWNLKVVPAG